LLGVAIPHVLIPREVVTSKSIVLPREGYITTLNNESVLRKVVVGANDPNDKTNNAGGYMFPQEITDGGELLYTIRFQNTGTDTAFSVVVRDTLENKIDLNSIEMISASHAYRSEEHTSEL